jgi:hypothetical protein
MVTVPAVLAARAHVPARVIVTTPLAPAAVEPVQVPVKPPLRVIVGLAGTVNALLKVTVIVLPELRAPVPLGVKPTAQDAVAPPVCGVPVKLTTVTAAVIVALPEFTAVVSELVLTLAV